MTTQSDIKKLAEQMAGSMNSFDDKIISFYAKVQTTTEVIETIK